MPLIDNLPSRVRRPDSHVWCQMVFVESHDPRMPRVAFFALHDIEPYQVFPPWISKSLCQRQRSHMNS